MNYQKETENIISSLGGKVPNLLLHACCAPCASYVLEYLSDYFRITVLYANSNIAPVGEFDKRLGELIGLVSNLEPKYPITLLCRDYEPELFYKAVRGLENEPEGGKRCSKCFELRLEDAAIVAKGAGFDYFTTTLTVSPHKDADVINEIGEALSKKYNIPWLFSDFKKRDGYKRSIELSKKYGLYRQQFCGCTFSQRQSPIENVLNGESNPTRYDPRCVSPAQKGFPYDEPGRHP